MRMDLLKQPPQAPTDRQRLVIDALAMLVYTTIVYWASVSLYPLGRDYAHLADAGRSLAFPMNHIWGWEVRTFGARVAGYHLVNLAVLYACMACAYRLVKLTVKGPVWLGTLAATLFMANPVHSEAVLNLCGVLDLLPCLMALAAITLYAESAEHPRAWKSVLAPMVFACAVLPFRANAMLWLVALGCEMFTIEDKRRAVPRLLPPLAISIVAWYLHADLFAWTNLHPGRMFAPLYFIAYPIGFLPENAHAFVRHPWLGWVSAGAAVAVTYLICRKARRPAILFGVFAMVAIRLFQGGAPVDPVHMVGGGQLLTATVFFYIAFVGLCRSIMQHPKWHRPVVIVTALLCVVFFVMEFRSVMAWRYASARVKTFQTEVASAPDVGIMPDYQYFQGAPMCLSESIKYDTPFGKAVRAASLLPMHYAPPAHITVEAWTPALGVVALEGTRPLDALCYPYGLMSVGGRQETPGATIRTLAASPGLMRFEIVPKAGPLPERLAPASSKH